MKYFSASTLKLMAAQDFPWLLQLMGLRRPPTLGPVSQEVLDQEYVSGRWDYLQGIDELARHGVVAAYCNHFAPRGSILEIGCGEGRLQRMLRPYDYSAYVGVDLSVEAIRKASKHSDDKTRFVVADGAEFATDDRFDLVVFNESLDYFDSPARTIRKHGARLTARGVLIVSAFVKTQNLKILARIEEGHDVEDETIVFNRQGTWWVVKVMRPQAGNLDQQRAAA